MVRHAQASFGTNDYDRLSLLGMKQAVCLGQHLKATHPKFEAVYLGGLNRHRQTLEGIMDSGVNAEETYIRDELNEYDAESLLAQLPSGIQQDSDHATHFKLLRQALQLWMSGAIQPDGMPTYMLFQQRLLALLADIRANHSGPVLIVSSGGPIATVIGRLLDASVAATISINYRIRNASITELAYDDKRHHVLGLNHVDHLSRLGNSQWITYV